MNSIIGVRGAPFAYSRQLRLAIVAEYRAKGGTGQVGVTNHELGAHDASHYTFAHPPARSGSSTNTQMTAA